MILNNFSVSFYPFYLVTDLLSVQAYVWKTMAVVVDRADLFVNQILKSFRPIRNTFIAIGVFYCAKTFVQVAYTGFRFLIRKKLPNYNWFPKHIWSKNYNKYGLVILNSDIVNQDRVLDLWNRASFRVLVDGAANSWYNIVKTRTDIINPVPDLVTGDFDSIEPSVKKYYEEQIQCKVIATSDQNYTDFTKSLQQIPLNLNTSDIREIYAFVEYGGRLDHVMGLFETLFHASKITNLPNVLLVSSHTTDWLLQPGIHTIDLRDERDKIVKCTDNDLSDPRYCGIIPIGQPCTNIKTSGLKWNLEKSQTLAFGKLVSTSNECCDETITIEIETPVIWTMKN